MQLLEVMFLLRLGYLVVPEGHVEPFRTIKAADTGSPVCPSPLWISSDRGSSNAIFIARGCATLCGARLSLKPSILTWEIRQKCPASTPAFIFSFGYEMCLKAMWRFSAKGQKK
jgi:hypothetical protein